MKKGPSQIDVDNFCFAAGNGNYAQVLDFLDQFGAAAIINGESSKNRQRALHHAAYLNSGADIVSLLLKHGADINALDGDGRTALMHAALRGAPEIVEVLLRHNAETHHQTFLGNTALDFAKPRRESLDLLALFDQHAERLRCEEKRRQEKEELAEMLRSERYQKLRKLSAPKIVLKGQKQ